jgi:hypothetical protein
VEHDDYGPNWTDLHYPLTHPFNPLSLDTAFQLSVAAAPAGHVVGAPLQPVLSASMSGGQFSISWSGGGILQYADQVTGPWSDLSAAASPYPAPMDRPQGFYRVPMP